MPEIELVAFRSHADPDTLSFDGGLEISSHGCTMRVRAGTLILLTVWIHACAEAAHSGTPPSVSGKSGPTAPMIPTARLQEAVSPPSPGPNQTIQPRLDQIASTLDDVHKTVAELKQSHWIRDAAPPLISFFSILLALVALCQTTKNNRRTLQESARGGAKVDS